MDVHDVLSLFSPDSFVVPASVESFFVMVGVLTGALFACERKLDVFGTVALGLVTGYGGGIIRDLLLQTQGIYFLEHPDLIVLNVVLCLFVFYFRSAFKSLDGLIFAGDTLSVALFAVAGANKAIASGQGFVVSVVLGFITAVGGGAVRDICTGTTPAIFKPSNFYALAALCGSFALVTLEWLGCPHLFSVIACVVTTLALRYLSVSRNWRTRAEADYVPDVAAAARRLRDLLRGKKG